ncbi:MAG: YaiI/YqxD family protein [Gammaproteobacteria bacterium]|nr:YaiI/YqxD family protein [Gammaproteobacteria bacterium]
MPIWVDADACPLAIKEILFRAATRTETMVTLVANQSIKVPPSRYITSLQVAAGFDVADNEIVRRCQANDLVITSDIPLASEVIEKGAIALSARGERYTSANIRAKLTMRDFMDTMRGSGLHTGGPPPLKQTDRKAFADQLDKWLMAQQKRR